MDKWEYTVVEHGSVGTVIKAKYHEQRHFTDLPQALVSALVTRDFIQFGYYSQDQDFDPKIDEMFIQDNSGKHPPVEIIDISIKDSIGNNIGAGIYIGYTNSTVADLEKNTGLSFLGFKEYDPGSPFVQIARYTYDRELNIEFDPAINVLIESLRNGIEENSKWNYSMETILHAERGVIHDHNTYHYSQLKDAFSDLMRLDISNMDSDLPQAQDTGMCLLNTHLYDAVGTKQAVVYIQDDIYVKHYQGESGVFLDLPQGVAAFEERLGTSLGIPHEFYKDGQTLKIGAYNEDYSLIGYLPAYEILRRNYPLEILTAPDTR